MPADLDTIAAQLTELKRDNREAHERIMELLERQDVRLREVERCQAVHEERLDTRTGILTALTLVGSAIAGYLGLQK